MTKEKHFKRIVREAAKRTGQSYAATRSRLDKRLQNPPRGPYDSMRALARAVELASEEGRAEFAADPSLWTSYDKRPEVHPIFIPPRAKELRDRLESLDDRDLFTALAITIWGKSGAGADQFDEVLDDARSCIENYGIDFAIDYMFKKLFATGMYFSKGLGLLERAQITPEACWRASGLGASGLPLQRRSTERPWS